MLSLTQVLSYFDNYLLASVILVALAITLIMLYISCYAWVFRVSATYNTKKPYPLPSDHICYKKTEFRETWIFRSQRRPSPLRED